MPSLCQTPVVQTASGPSFNFSATREVLFCVFSARSGSKVLRTPKNSPILPTHPSLPPNLRANTTSVKTLSPTTTSSLVSIGRSNDPKYFRIADTHEYEGLNDRWKRTCDPRWWETDSAWRPDESRCVPAELDTIKMFCGPKVRWQSFQASWSSGTSRSS